MARVKRMYLAARRCGEHYGRRPRFRSIVDHTRRDHGSLRRGDDLTRIDYLPVLDLLLGLTDVQFEARRPELLLSFEALKQWRCEYQTSSEYCEGDCRRVRSVVGVTQHRSCDKGRAHNSDEYVGDVFRPLRHSAGA